MARRLTVLWIPLFAALLAGPLVVRAPVQVWSGEATLRGVDARSSAVSDALPVARFQPALHPRFPIDRHGGQLWSLYPAGPESSIPIARLRAPQAATRDSRPATYYFPLFPTGPPSHG